MNKIGFLAIGDITTDAFIKIKDASVNCDIDRHNCKLCLNFADKVPYESVHVIHGVGNSANAAVCATRLGLSSSLIAFIGKDENGKLCEKALKNNGVKTKYLIKKKDKKTNYHYALWYEDERTILVKHEEFDYFLPRIQAPKWMYISSLASNSFNYHLEIADFLKKNPNVKLVFQPGTFQMKLGYEKLKDIYARSEVFVCNVEEAQRILSLPQAEIKELLYKMRELGPKIVSITDGPKGAYAYDGKDAWFMPIYPDPKPPLERTGCGDAYTSTLIVALSLGKTLEEALLWAPINPMSVVQYIGAQEGLLDQEALLKLLEDAPADYKPRKM